MLSIAMYVETLVFVHEVVDGDRVRKELEPRSSVAFHVDSLDKSYRDDVLGSLCFRKAILSTRGNERVVGYFE